MYIYQEATDDLLVSHFLHEHSYCKLENLKFDRQSLRYLQRTSEEEESILTALQPVDAEDLKYLRRELESRHPKIKWTPYPEVKTRREVRRGPLHI